MNNLKKLNGTYKGLIGECMFKLTRKWVVITKYWNKLKYMQIFGKYMNSVQREFILTNWHSLDAIEITFTNGKKQITLYEIKTKNEYNVKLFFKLKMTESTHRIYQIAKKAGFNTKIAIVHFTDDWNYYTKIVEFNEASYCIDKPKKYDKI